MRLIPEHKTKTLILADSSLYPEVSKAIGSFISFLKANGISFQTLPFQSPTPWIRDWFYTFLCHDLNNNIVFCVNSMKESYETRRMRKKIDLFQRDVLVPYLRSRGSVEYRPGINLDGGSVSYNDRICLISSKALVHNSICGYEGIRNYLDSIISDISLHIMPYPGDFTGHIDGSFRFVENTFLYDSIFDPFIDPSVYSDDFISIDLPEPPNINNAFGDYLGFILMEGKILLPSFGIPQDNEILSLFKERFRDYTIIQIPSDICITLADYTATPHCIVSQI
ncbi:MAG: hypothetical protein WHS38_03715 [Thermodesulforhabdaceae bacterium]|jgi:hypothetical protein